MSLLGDVARAATKMTTQETQQQSRQHTVLGYRDHRVMERGLGAHRLRIQRPLHQETNQKCHGCEFPKNLYQKWQYRDTAPANTPTQIENYRGCK